VKKLIRNQSVVNNPLLSSPLSRSVTTTSSLLTGRTISSGGSAPARKTPLPTVNEDLSSSEEVYSEEDEPLVIEKVQRKTTDMTDDTKIEPLSVFQVIKFIASGFLPTKITSFYFENN
jgi:hypothetical protein